MVDGKHLSGDHSFKLTNYIMSNGSKTFTALCTMMNEYGQVAGFWFTTGTGMQELKECIQKLKVKYENFGFEGPYLFTTDRCCQERKYWNDNLHLGDAPGATCISDDNDGSAEDDGNNIGNTIIVPVVALPCPARVATNRQVLDNLVGEISAEIQKQPAGGQAFALDCEWTVGSTKAETLQIGLPNGQTFVFHLAKICRSSRDFPAPLKMLLEIEGISKVGWCIDSDV